MSAFDGIPSIPRPVRWRACLRHRWVFGILAASLAVSGLLPLVLMSVSGLRVLPFADDALDSGAARTEGRIVSVAPTGARLDGQRLDEVVFEFAAADGTFRGRQQTMRRVRPGERHEIEFLAARPATSRLAGTRLAPIVWFTYVFGTAGALGVVALLSWLRGVTAVRIALREGPLRRADVVSVRTLKAVNPPQLRIDYRFVDRDGVRHEAWQSAGRKSALAAIAEPGGTLPVIHADGNPRVRRLVTAADFVGAAARTDGVRP